MQSQQTRNEASDATTESIPLDLNLRLVWGGPKPARYNVQIELDNGLLAGIQQLGIDENDPSFILKDAEGRLAIVDLDTRFGGCDIRTQSKSNSKLRVRMEVYDPETSQSSIKEFSWSMRSLCDTPDLQDIGLASSRISIDRVPGDRLRVVTQRNHLIYNSDEPLNLSIQAYGLPWASTAANIDCSLVRLEDEQPVYRKSKLLQLDGRGHGEPYEVVTNAPKEEGVYELRFRIEPRRILPGLIIRHPSIERVVQFVVFNNIPPARSQVSGLHSDVDATSEWQPQSRLPLKDFETQTLTSLLLNRIEGSKRLPFFDFAKSLSILPKEAVESNASEESKTSDERLSLIPGGIASSTIGGLVPGKMHRLTLLSSKPSDTYRVRISPLSARDQKTRAESWAHEVYDAPPTDTIAQVGNLNSPEAFQRMQVLFWPNARAAKLELTNLNATSSLSIVDAGVDVWPSPTEIGKASDTQTKSPRCVLELQSPNVRSAFGAESNSNSNFTSSTSNASMAYDDWRVYLRFVGQIGPYCNANGFDCLAMTVHAQGASLFPSSKLSANARFDTGTFSADGRDPIRKDVVELLYRGMSRYGVEFVPVLEMDSPIREVEEMLQRTDHRELLQCRDNDAQRDENGLSRYNPLSSRVQQAIATALDEFDRRYHSQSNYRGYALRSSSPSHLEVALPIDQTNRMILDQFATSVGGNLPKDANQREQFIAQKLLNAYSQWIKENAYGFLSKLKAKPRWVSIDSGRGTNAEQQSTTILSPIQLGRHGIDYYEIQGAITQQWSLGTPGPIHVAMEKPLNRIDSRFSRLPAVANEFQVEPVRSLPYRDSSRSISKVRVWHASESSRSLLITNSGAVTEWVFIHWDTLPNDYFASTTHENNRTPLESRIECDVAAKQWRIQVAAGETIRIASRDGYFTPVHWNSHEHAAAQTIEAGLQSLEQAVSRLSTPQARANTITNPSFEMQTSVSRRGRLVGWTTSIDSNTKVDIDSRTASEGRASIKIEASNAASIAWLQSDPFALTHSDRLFISFQVLAQQVPETATLTLYQFDPKSDHFESVAIRGFANRIPSSSKQSEWGNIGLDFSKEIQTFSKGDEPSLYRIQFETKGIGGFWLDDVSLSTSFLRDTERRDLRSELFLARTSLQNGDSGPAVTMLASPRGSLAQWGDSFVSKPKVMVSLKEQNESTPSSLVGRNKSDPNIEPKTKEGMSGESKSSETKLRPIQRLRNSWWFRRD